MELPLEELGFLASCTLDLPLLNPELNPTTDQNWFAGYTVPRMLLVDELRRLPAFGVRIAARMREASVLFLA